MKQSTEYRGDNAKNNIKDERGSAISLEAWFGFLILEGVGILPSWNLISFIKRRLRE